MRKKTKNLLLIVVAAIVVLGTGILAYGYSIYSTGFDIDKTVYVYVDHNKDYNKLLQELKDSAKLKNTGNFNRIASYRNYPQNMKTGRYAISPNDNAWSIVNKLNKGLQTPMRVTFNNVRLKEDLVDKIAAQFMFNGGDLFAVLNNYDRCASYGFTPQTIVAMFIPNTYEFYWDTSVDNFMARMRKEYDRVWNEDRLQKAQKLDLTPLDVSTLASIVEEECMFGDEYPVVAGLYLNRLRRGQLLQADPTVKYAVGDFSLQRILFKHLAVDSPYNTYLYKGLPPSPIRVPSLRGIDAVLNPAEHNYLYMCAKDDFAGRHAFATNLSEHNRNAARYQMALNKRGIY